MSAAVLELVESCPEETADHILQGAVEVAINLIRDGRGETARLILDRAQRFVERALAGAAC